MGWKEGGHTRVSILCALSPVDFAFPSACWVLSTSAVHVATDSCSVSREACAALTCRSISSRRLSTSRRRMGRLVVSYSAVCSKLLVRSEIPDMIYQFGGVPTTPHILETAAKDLSPAPRTFSNALIIGLTAASASALFRLLASESSSSPPS